MHFCNTNIKDSRIPFYSNLKWNLKPQAKYFSVVVSLEAEVHRLLILDFDKKKSQNYMESYLHNKLKFYWQNDTAKGKYLQPQTNVTLFIECNRHLFQSIGVYKEHTEYKFCLRSTQYIY